MTTTRLDEVSFAVQVRMRGRAVESRIMEVIRIIQKEINESFVRLMGCSAKHDFEYIKPIKPELGN